MNLTISQFGQRVQAFLQELLLTLHDEIVIRCQRCAAEAAHKDGLGLVVGVGRSAEGPLAQHRPQATTQHHRFDFFIGMGYFQDQRSIVVCFHHHFQKFSFLPTDYGFHLSSNWRSESDALIVFIAKQGITHFDGISFFYQQLWRKSSKISRFHRIGRNIPRIGEALFRRPANGNIQAFPYGDGIGHNLEAKI